MRRVLTDSERVTLTEALEEGLSVQQAGVASTLTVSCFKRALGEPPPAKLWACVLEVAEGGMQQSVSALANAVVDACAQTLPPCSSPLHLRSDTTHPVIRG